METFEIHITGSHGINQELDLLGIKNIVVELLNPKLELMRTEYMSSFIIKKQSILECKDFVDELLTKLKTQIIRVKIESPFYEHYREQALYLESHFKPFNALYPISRNARSKKLMATDRTYEKGQYDVFKDKWINEDVEMCLYDTFIEEDSDWFKLYLQY
jgi:hypothetical protein